VTLTGGTKNAMEGGGKGNVLKKEVFAYLGMVPFKTIKAL